MRYWLYVGETSRTVGSIKEHITTKQTVYKHLSHKNGTPTLSNINWRILHANIPQHSERKYIEEFGIQNRGHKLMNGCVGRIISVSVLYCYLQNNVYCFNSFIYFSIGFFKISITCICRI